MINFKLRVCFSIHLKFETKSSLTFEIWNYTTLNVDDKPGSDDEGSLGGDQEAANRDTGATGVGSDSGGSLVDMASVENLPPGSFR